MGVVRGVSAAVLFVCWSILRNWDVSPGNAGRGIPQSHWLYVLGFVPGLRAAGWIPRTKHKGLPRL